MEAHQSRLKRQLVNLEEFLAEKKHLYAHFRYSPWTSNPSTNGVEVRPSSLVEGSLALVATREIKTSSLHHPIFLADYVGVLMWHELHEEFDSRYHCPTAVESYILDYDVDEAEARRLELSPQHSFDEDTNTWTVHVFVVGDPTTHASITNSPRDVRARPNAQLAQCTVEVAQEFLSGEQLNELDGKIIVPASFLRLLTVKGNIRAGDEILTRYDDSEAGPGRQRRTGEPSTYWGAAEERQREQPYCDTCFQRQRKDQVVTCAAMKRSGCTVMRHCHCFKELLHGRWFCPLHELRLAAPSTNVSVVDSSGADVDMSTEIDDGATVASSSTINTSVYPRASTAGGRRVQNSLSVPKKRSQPDSYSTEAGRQKVLDVYKAWVPRIQACKPMTTGWFKFDTPEQEADAVKKLDEEVSVIKNCCMSTSRFVEMVQSGQMHMKSNPFDTAASMLDVRFRWREKSGFVKKQWSARFTEMIEQRTADASGKKRVVFEGVPLCDGCLIAAVGISRSTLYRKTGAAPASAPSTAGDVKVRSGTLTQRYAEALLEFANAEGQHLPTADGQTKHGYTHFVLPYRTFVQTRECLQERLRQLHCNDLLVIKPTTFSRAIEELKNRLGVTLNIKVWKKLAKCDMCTYTTSILRLGRLSDNATIFDAVQRIKREHDSEWQEQRRWFDSRKALALSKPWELVVFTHDGMDQAKTSLPHFHRLTNDTKNSEHLKLRLVGGFAFGGCVPCMGFFSYENVKGKGANASVMAMERMIDLQFVSQDTSRWQRIEQSDAKTGERFGGFDMERVEKDRLNQEQLDDSSSASESKSDSPDGVAPMDVDRDDAAGPDPKPVSSGFQIVDELPDESNPPCRQQSSMSTDSFWNGDAASPEGTRPKPAFMWPRGAHFTFDNTASDTKNSTCFRWLAELVSLGVYMHVTVSCLMVGHTHDIVDQMFSVWSRQLGEVDAPTLEKMIEHFTKKYKSNMYTMKEMMMGLTNPVPVTSRANHTQQLRELMDQFDPQIKKRIEEEVMQSNGEFAPLTDALDGSAESHVAPDEDAATVAEESAEPVDKGSIHRRLKVVARMLGVKPHLELTKTIANIDRWYAKDKAIADLSSAHVFLIQRERLTDDLVDTIDPVTQEKVSKVRDYDSIVMYSRFLAQSYEDKTVYHNRAYTDKMCGPYTARLILRENADDCILEDPMMLPPVPVKTEAYRQTFDAHRKSGQLNEKDAEVLESVVRGFDDESKQLEESCQLCAHFAHQLADIGPIRQSTTEAEKAHSNAQKTKKASIERDRTRHWADELYYQKHRAFVMDDWWRKWVRRVKEVIRPYYIARGLISVEMAEERRATGRRMHPPRLPGSKDAIVHNRVDHKWVLEYGAPVVGDFIATRSHSAEYPVYLAVVVEVDPELTRLHPITSKRRKLDASKKKVADRAAETEAAASKVKPSKKGAPVSSSAATSVAPRKSCRLKSSVPNLCESDVEDDRSDDDFKSSSDDDDEEGLDEGVPQPAKRLKPNSSGAAASAAASASSHVPMVVDSGDGAAAAASNSSRPAGIVEESSSVLNEAGRRARAMLDGRFGVEEVQLQRKIKVQWWEWVRSTYSIENDPYNSALWQGFAKSLKCVDKWNEAVRLREAGVYAPIPQEMFEKWRKMQFAETSTVEVVSFADCILWSPNLLRPVTVGDQRKKSSSRKVLNMNGVYTWTADTWKRVVEDTCELADAEVGNLRNYREEAEADGELPKKRRHKKQATSAAAASACSEVAAAAAAAAGPGR